MQQHKPYLQLWASYVRTTLLALFLSLILPSFAIAATFVVNSSADTHDLDLKDGVCKDAFGNCTFRAAIEQANYLDVESYSEPHIIDMTSLKEDILLSLGEIPPLIHIRLVGNGEVPSANQHARLTSSARRSVEVSDFFYPNPKLDEATLDLRSFNSDELSITIIDDLGYPVDEFDLSGFHNVRITLDLAEYDLGVYWVKITQSEDRTFLKQLVVSNW